jgi:hypothetical protein
MTETPIDRVLELGRTVKNGLEIAVVTVGVPLFLAPDFRSAVIGSLFLLALAVGMTEYGED